VGTPADLHTLGLNPALLPPFVQESALARRYLDLLSPLAWERFPERNLAWQPTPVPYAALAAACLVKLDQQLVSMGRLRQYLVDHPPCFGSAASLSNPRRAILVVLTLTPACPQRGT
jgi:hypothetical protein